MYFLIAKFEVEKTIGVSENPFNRVARCIDVYIYGFMLLTGPEYNHPIESVCVKCWKKFFRSPWSGAYTTYKVTNEQIYKQLKNYYDGRKEIAEN